ncbi:MAG: gephyrin-like molybdotransferase Glp [Planctomycetaceae bacterium]
MLSVSEALALIAREVVPREPATVNLADALGLVLSEEIRSDVDSPPFDKALMDGYAVRAADVADGNAELRVIEEISAGSVPRKSIAAGEAARIMTGAPVPDGADAVVRIEDSSFDAATSTVQLKTRPVVPGLSILRRGSTKKAGEIVLPRGRLLRPQELGALAEVGAHRISARSAPRIGVLATGNELVPISALPGPGQIRNSNETMLCAQVCRAGGIPVPLGVARDDATHLAERIAAGLECDVLILSGGVSAGKFDLVPSQLAAAGVRQVFHQVNVKPGKPVWFGVLDQAAAGQGHRYVFGLPGNPVSSLVCFELFVRTAVRLLMGQNPAEPQPIRARLTKAHIARGDRPTYNPARLEWTESGPTVTPLPWHGSSDLQATIDANAMALFDAGDREWKTGEQVNAILWD